MPACVKKSDLLCPASVKTPTQDFKNISIAGSDLLNNVNSNIYISKRKSH